MNRNNFSFFYTLRVRYAEVDAQGIVFNAHYLTYFDCAITEYYRKIKYDYYAEAKNSEKDFHVIKTILNYKKPLLFDQKIDVGVRVDKIGVSSLTFDLAIFNNKGKDLLAYGSIIQVYADQIKKCSTPLTKDFILKIKKFENNL